MRARRALRFRPLQGPPPAGRWLASSLSMARAPAGLRRLKLVRSCRLNPKDETAARSAGFRAAGRGRLRIAGAGGGFAVGQRRLGGGRHRRADRPGVRPRPGRAQAGAAVLGRELVPAVQPAQGDAVQPPGLRRAVQVVRRGRDRRRPAGGAEARRALQGAAATRRWCCSRRTAPRSRACPARPMRRRCWRCCRRAWPAGGRSAAVLADARARQADQRRRMAHARVLLVGCRRAAAGAGADRAARMLAELAAKVPAGDGETATRLWLKALAASDDGKGLQADAALRSACAACCADPAQARAQMDVIDQRRGRDRQGAASGAAAPSARRWSRRSTRRCSACRTTRRCRAPTAPAR